MVVLINNGQQLETGSSLAESAYSIQESDNTNGGLRVLIDDVSTSKSVLTQLREDIIAPKNKSISSPFFSNVPMIYCDHTASNRALNTIETFIRDTVLPLYANTHTTTSHTGSQSTAWMAEARQIVAEACNARITGKASQDVVLFTGSGATGAIELALELSVSTWRSKGTSCNNRVIVFVGPMEHHSNMLPYRELGKKYNDLDVTVINVPPKSPRNGAVDTDRLELMLQSVAGETNAGTLMIGCFSAASNVTGLLSDVPLISRILHKYGALSFIDYATASPYIEIDVNFSPDARIDAAFISTHKIVGGVNTPGILVIKKSLINRTIAPPTRVGGGTVFYTTESDTFYTTNWVDRNEGGTPNVVGSIRCGLTFLNRKKLLRLNYVEEYKEICSELGNPFRSDSVGKTLSIREFECKTRDLAINFLKERASNIIILGDNEEEYKEDHLPIISFLVRCGDRYLHYNLVCAILNDVFGVQSRGGCQCAGPYAQRLLGLSSYEGGSYVPTMGNDRILEILVNEKAELLRPGFSRISLNLTLSPKEIRYVLSSIVWVCRNGFKLCAKGFYGMNSRTGEWRHKMRQSKPLGDGRIWLTNYSSGEAPTEHSELLDLDISLDRAESLLEGSKSSKEFSTADIYEEVRWFLTPSDCARLLELASSSSSMSDVLNGPIRIDVNEFSCQNNDALQPASGKLKYEVTDAQMFSFRDGEFSGEAKLSEIVDGHDSGELSDTCVVFFDEKWLVISEVIAKFSSSNLGNSQDNETKENDNSISDQIMNAGTPVVCQKDEAEMSNEKCAIAKAEKKKRHYIIPSKKFMRSIQKAIIEHDMILENDILLLGLSGGKDSLSLLHILIYLQAKLPQKFTIKVLTVDPGSSGYDPSSLVQYIGGLRDGYGQEIEYHYVKQDIMDRAYERNFGGDEKNRVTSICAYCARMKRGIMYSTMRKCGANKLVLAQHLDDGVESTMMSLMHNGFLRTMKAHYTINMGDLAVIRPLVYTREAELTAFALEHNLPIINENCPACFEEPKERARIKKLLAREEALFSNLYDNMRKAIIPLMHADSSALMWSYTNQTLEKSRKDKRRTKNGVSNGTKPKVNTREEHKCEQTQSKVLLREASEDELIVELARRRAEKFALKGSLQKQPEPEKSTTTDAPVCSINGGPGTIPCYELME